MRIAILGGGIAGLELGRQLKAAGRDFVILEKESVPGGLCRTNRTGDYLWDFGVHAIYSRDPEITAYYRSLPIDAVAYERKVKVFHVDNKGKKHILDYPFETGVHGLPLSEKLECFAGYVAARTKGPATYANLREWMDKRLGAGMAKCFMLPYNHKIWDCPLEGISPDLVHSRIEPPSAWEFLQALAGKKVLGRAYQSRFLYPRQGIEALIEHISRDVPKNIASNFCVKRLLRENGGWTITSDVGATEKADMVVSTLPLAELLKMVDIPGLEDPCEALKWNDTFFVMVGLNKDSRFQLIDDCQWVFFKGDEIFYRVTLMHNLIPQPAPVLVAEVTRKGDVRDRSLTDIRDMVVRDLIRQGIVASADHIQQTDTRLSRYTYPIPTVGLRAVRNRIADVLAREELFLLGRAGNWEYLNIDDVLVKTRAFFRQRVGAHG